MAQAWAVQAPADPLPAPDQPTGRVLVVEDDPTVADVVARYLRRDGHEVDVVGDGLLALARAERSRPDVVVLDLMLPGLQGLEVCRRLRSARLPEGTAPVGIIVLSARGAEDDRVTGLDHGADDYLAKPFSPRELAARVRSLLRRSDVAATRAADGQLVVGDLALDAGARTLHRAGTATPLTAREFDLLEFFLRNPRRAFGRQQLLERVWGHRVGDLSTVTVHVRRLREKVEPDPSSPTHIVTVWGTGYRFDPDPATDSATVTPSASTTEPT